MHIHTLYTATVQCKEWAQVFRFDHVLWSHAEQENEDVHVSQEGVHKAIGVEMVENVLNGISASCFAYGHTGIYVDMYIYINTYIYIYKCVYINAFIYI
jgi:hypothetical protein